MRFIKKILNFKVISDYKFALKSMEAEVEILDPVLTADSANRDAFFEEMYQSVFPAVASFVNEMNGSYSDAKDIFQDSLIIYFERLSDNVTITSSPERYILGIAKHLWLRKFRVDRKRIALDDFEKALRIPDDFYPDVKVSRILQYMEAAGTKCLNLLRSFYFEKDTLKDVAARLGYSTEHSAAVQKYKCLEKIRELIKENSMTYEDFFE